MDFLTYLEKYENVNVSDVKDVFESTKKMDENIIAEAFSSEYSSKKEAIFNLENIFVSEDTAPKGVDAKYVSENLDKLKEKVETLTEGDIRIIIHNHEAPKDKKGGTVEYEEESAMPKAKRGRPKKGVDQKKVPNDTPVVYDDPAVVSEEGETPEEVEEACGDDHKEVKEEDDQLFDKKTKKDVDAKEEVSEESEEVEESKISWSDIEKSLSEEESTSLDELAEMDLSEEELKTATEIAEAGTIEECGDDRMAKAAKLIGMLKKDKGHNDHHGEDSEEETEE